MSAFNRRDFVLGSSALGLLLAARSGLAANPDRRLRPDEYFLIDSQNPKVTGYREAVHSYVDLLYQLA